MDRSDDVRIYNASCETFEGLLRFIEPRSVARRDLTVMPGDRKGDNLSSPVVWTLSKWDNNS